MKQFGRLTLIFSLIVVVCSMTLVVVSAQTDEYGFAPVTVTDPLTIPDDFPSITVTVPANGAADGYIFTAAHVRGTPYLLILDNDGEPIYYQRMDDPVNLFDFRPHPDSGQGVLSYFTRYQGAVTGFKLDNAYNFVGDIEPVAFPAASLDFHDYHILPNGNDIVVLYDMRPVDMSAVVENGNPNAQLIEFAFEERDTDGNLIFSWSSEGKYDISQANASLTDLTQPLIDYVHGNAVEPDTDGNYLVTVRNYSEITKIDGETGDVIWRLGGANNEFTFTNDPLELSSQHDTRRLENGNLLIFDNQYDATNPTLTRVVEYAIDEVNMIATKVWEFSHPSNIYTRFAGNAQRLSNGNTLIGWGSSNITPSPLTTGQATLTEVDTNGDIVFEMQIVPHVIYRAYRFPWVGQPAQPPALIATPNADSFTINYSWNGATEVDSYQVYVDGSLVGTQPAAGFEQSSLITPAAPGTHQVQVIPLDADGTALTPSPSITVELLPTTVGIQQAATGTTDSAALVWVLSALIMLTIVVIDHDRNTEIGN